MTRRKQDPLSGMIQLAALAALAAAIIKELSKPASERTWHGVVAKCVPYDLRMPTMARVRERLWAPEDPQIVKPQVFGVGWTVNLGRIVAMARGALARLSDAGAA